MASAEYYRRQAETCLRMSLLSSDLDETKRLLRMAEEYRAKAEKCPELDENPVTQPSSLSGKGPNGGNRDPA